MKSFVFHRVATRDRRLSLSKRIAEIFSRESSPEHSLQDISHKGKRRDDSTHSCFELFTWTGSESRSDSNWINQLHVAFIIFPIAAMLMNGELTNHAAVDTAYLLSCSTGLLSIDIGICLRMAPNVGQNHCDLEQPNIFLSGECERE